MNTSENLQNLFLNTVKDQEMPVTISLTNGFQFRGVITEFDDSVILLEADKKLSMIYKLSVASITPGKMIKID
ncbi:MAG: RNA chaperone Hfq [Oscillospiraceae bacterium]